MARAGGLMIGIKLLQEHLQSVIWEDKVSCTCETHLKYCFLLLLLHFS